MVKNGSRVRPFSARGAQRKRGRDCSGFTLNANGISPVGRGVGRRSSRARSASFDEAADCTCLIGFKRVRST